MRRKPLIGITAGYDYDKGSTYIKKGYIEGINRAGGLAVLLPATPDKELVLSMIQQFDGFLLSGGGDIDAENFSEANLPFNGELSPYRDSMEIIITKESIKQNKPIFGVCRGIQIMNVAMGGSIYQDIYSQISDRQLLMHIQDAPKWYPVHSVHIERNSKLKEWFKQKQIRVNSFHHQAVRNVAQGFKVTARAGDGIIEAIEYIGHKFAIGVQWHPELMWQRDERFFILFEQFVNAVQ